MNSTKAAISAAKTIRKSVFAMTLTRTIAGTFDPATGSETGGSTVEWTVYGIKTGIGSIARYPEYGLRPGGLIQQGDVMVIMEAGVVVPQPGDMLTLKTVPWRIVALDGIDPAGINIIYKVLIRR